MPEQPTQIAHEGSARSELVALQQLELMHRSRIAARAQWFALTALAMTLGAIITLSLTGHDTVAGVIAGSVIVPVVGLYITARYPQVQRTDTVGPALTARPVVQQPQE